MANTLTVTFELTGQGTLVKDMDLSQPSDSVSIGSGDFLEITNTFENGTSTDQANEWWHDERTLAATTGESLDLTGTALQNAFGENIAFTVIKWVLIKIVEPDGTKSLRFGPQGVANTWQGPYGDASDYETFTDWLFKLDRYSGWTVTAGTGDLMRIYNPGAGNVTYQIWVGGEK